MSSHDVEAVAERLRDLNEEIIDAGRRAGGSVLLLYEQSLCSIAAIPESLSVSKQATWFTEIVAAEADFMRALVDTYTSLADPSPEH